MCKIDEYVENFFLNNPEEYMDVLVVMEAPSYDLFLGNDGTIPNITIDNDQYDDLLHSLEELGIKDLVWLSSAQTFVANINVHQFRQICSLPGIQEIVPNSRLMN